MGKLPETDRSLRPLNEVVPVAWAPCQTWPHGKSLISLAGARNRENSESFGVAGRAPLGLSLTFVKTPLAVLTVRS